MAGEVRADCNFSTGPVDLYLPDNNGEVRVGWKQPLTIHFTERCKVCFDDPKAFATLYDEVLPDGQVRGPGNPWGPGYSQDTYACKTITYWTVRPNEDCHQGRPGSHPIIIGSSGKQDAVKPDSGPKHLGLPDSVGVTITPGSDQLELDFTKDCKFELLFPDDACSFRDASRNCLPDGKCFHKGDTWGPASATVEDALIFFATPPGCPEDVPAIDNAAASGHVIIVGSGNGDPFLKVMAEVFLSERTALKSWPETRKFLGDVIDVPGLIRPLAVNEFLGNLVGAGDKLYKALHRK